MAAIAVVQTRIVQECQRQGKPVIVATQMLDSMHHNRRPTRAELAACRPDVLLDSLEEWPELLAAIGLSPDPVLAGFS